MAGVKKVYAKDMFARLIDDFVKAKEENLSKEEFIPKEKKRYHDIRYGLDMDDSIYILWEFDIDELIDALDYIFTDNYIIDKKRLFALLHNYVKDRKFSRETRTGLEQSLDYLSALFDEIDEMYIKRAKFPFWEMVNAIRNNEFAIKDRVREVTKTDMWKLISKVFSDEINDQETYDAEFFKIYDKAYKIMSNDEIYAPLFKLYFDSTIQYMLFRGIVMNISSKQEDACIKYHSIDLYRKLTNEVPDHVEAGDFPQRSDQKLEYVFGIIYMMHYDDFSKITNDKEVFKKWLKKANEIIKVNNWK